MKRTSLLSLVALIAAGVTPAAAQAKVGGLVQVWWNITTPEDVRNNTAATKYYNLRGEFKENTFAIRRVELKFSGKITDDVEYEAMIDPSQNITTTAGPANTLNILQDANITWKSGVGFDVKMGQMKAFQTYEGLNSSSELMLVERSQMGRTIGDVRQRGIAAIYGYGDPKDFAGKIVLGAFNGAVKQNDGNAQKDFVARLEFTAAKDHKFGIYTLQGSTDLNDKATSPLTARTFSGVNTPTSQEILDNKDKTSHVGAFYVYQTADLLLSAEYINGLLGRGYGIASTATLVNGAAAPALREHLDQKFMGYVLTGAYTMGSHTLLARYDFMNYNQGDKWYTATNPYKTATADFTPKYREITVGYLYAFKPETLKAANFKLNYIARSKNFLAPRAAAGETSEQGGNTLVAAFQVAF
ncbi:MAG TPA: porin [Holophagaceae bacterium]|nr:porin [Holophagaceae bacterium]